MKPESVSLLCDPDTHDAFEVVGSNLRNSATGRIYPMRDGIPLFLGSVTGLNRKYQAMYDRLAPGYDLAERLYRFFTRKADYRLAYIPELEIGPGARVLEVSVGTGANLRYLPRDAELFGIDLSWGMLRKCARNVRRWRLGAELFQAEAERLPFPSQLFDSVFHVGGINFFSDKGRAIREMVRVAKPGTKIVIVDETEQIVREHYQRNPATARYYEPGTENVRCPVDLVPAGMLDVRAREIYEGKLYCLTFRTPGAETPTTERATTAARE